MTRTETAKLLALITATFPTLTLTGPTLEAWYDLLGDLDFAIAQAALQRVLLRQEGSWWPTPGSIRAAVGDLRGAGGPDVDAAWGAVMDAIRRYGYMQENVALAQLPPLVAQVVRHIGWTAVCEADPDVCRGQFRRVYEAAQATAREQSTLPPALQQGAWAADAERPAVPVSRLGAPRSFQDVVGEIAMRKEATES